jgi:hypothetical protein
MKRHVLFFTLLISLLLLGNQLAIAESSFFDFGAKKETPKVGYAVIKR